MTKQQFEVRAYSTKKLCQIYQVNERTFNKWLLPYLHEIGEKVGYLYNHRQVQIILDRLGPPPAVKEST